MWIAVLSNNVKDKAFSDTMSIDVGHDTKVREKGNVKAVNTEKHGISRERERE